MNIRTYAILVALWCWSPVVVALSTQSLLKEYQAVATSAATYYQQVGYLPSSILELIELNLLTEQQYENIKLVANQGKIYAHITAPVELLNGLQNYILGSAIQNGVLIAPISLDALDLDNNTTTNTTTIIFCSNLYCPEY